MFVYFVNFRDGINVELWCWFGNSILVYEKFVLLKVLAEFGWNYKYIYWEGVFFSFLVIWIVMMEVFNMISGWLDFRVFFGVGYWSVCCELLGMYLEVM